MTDGASPDLSPREAIEAAAHRVAGFAEALIEAHVDFGVAHGPFDDLTDPAFHAAARDAFSQTVPDDQLDEVALAFGAVAVMMAEQAAAHPHIAANPKWVTVEQFMRRAAAAGGSADLDVPADVPALGLLRRPTPRIVRFELVAALVSASGVARLFDAASWVAEIAPTLHGEPADAPVAASVPRTLAP